MAIPKGNTQDDLYSQDNASLYEVYQYANPDEGEAEDEDILDFEDLVADLEPEEAE